MFQKFLHLFPKEISSGCVVSVLDLLVLANQDGLGLAVVVRDLGVGSKQERHSETAGFRVHDDVVLQQLLSGDFASCQGGIQIITFNVLRFSD